MTTAMDIAERFRSAAVNHRMARLAVTSVAADVLRCTIHPVTDEIVADQFGRGVKPMIPDGDTAPVIDSHFREMGGGFGCQLTLICGDGVKSSRTVELPSLRRTDPV